MCMYMYTVHTCTCIILCTCIQYTHVHAHIHNTCTCIHSYFYILVGLHSNLMTAGTSGFTPPSPIHVRTSSFGSNPQLHLPPVTQVQHVSIT